MMEAQQFVITVNIFYIPWDGKKGGILSSHGTGAHAQLACRDISSPLAPGSGAYTKLAVGNLGFSLMAGQGAHA